MMIPGVSGAFTQAKSQDLHEEHTVMLVGSLELGYWTCSCGESFGSDESIVETHIQDVMMLAEEPTFVNGGDEWSEDFLEVVNERNEGLKAVLTK